MLKASRPGSSWLEFLGLEPNATEPAIVTPLGNVTRGELASAVLQATESLSSLAAGDLVAVRFERGDPRSIVATLALWQRGAVPIFDEPVSQYSQNVDPMMSIGPVATLDGAPNFDSATQLISHHSIRLRQHPMSSPPVLPAEAAYLIRTSGSTGRPRAAVNSHDGLRNTVNGLKDRYHLSESSRSLQFASIAYDAWLADSLPVLYAGGTVVYGNRGHWSGFRQLTSAISELDVTHVVLPPSLWRQLDRLERIEVAISAGEALDTGVASQLARVADRVINAYGPAEAAICATTHEVRPNDGPIPLGRALPGVEISLVENELGMHLIQIEGAGVGLGYLEGGHLVDTAGVTSNSGLFGSGESGRYFLTSDTAERVGQNLLFSGRTDRRLKRHGRFLNLDEVELAVRTSPNVVDCVVSLAEDRLICRAVLADPSEPVDLRQLSTPLQPWEVPELQIESDLSRSQSDKLERTAPKSKDVVDDLTAAVIRSLWASHLTAPRDDLSFFALGGDSLGAMTLLDEVADKTGVEVDIADFLTDPTLDGLVVLVSRCSIR